MSGNYSLQLLVAAVTAAERGELMPSTQELQALMGCGKSHVGEAFRRLVRAGVLRNLAMPKTRRRVLVVATGAVTADARNGLDDAWEGSE